MNLTTYKFKNNEIKNDYANISSYLNLALFTMGVIGNAICIYVFGQQEMRRSKFNWFLLVIAIYELIFCLILSLDYIFQFINNEKILLHQFNKTLYIIFDITVHAIDSYLSIIRLILSVDRLYAIRNQLNMKNFVTNLNSKFFNLTIFFIILFLRIPSAFLCSRNIDTLFFLSDNISYCSVLTIIVFHVIPVVLILIINCSLIKEIIKKYRNKSPDFKIDKVELMVFYKNCTQNTSLIINRMNGRLISKTQNSYYFVIIASSCWLVFTTTAYYIFSASSYMSIVKSSLVDEEYIQKTRNLRKIQHILTILFNSNHCINILIYFPLYSIFRKFFKTLLSSTIRKVGIRNLEFI